MESVKERLEKLREKHSIVAKPLGEKKEPKLSMDAVYQKKLENALTKIEAIKKKMEIGTSFLNYYNDLKAAEKEFLDILNEAREKGVVFTEQFEKKVKETEKNIR